MNEKRLNIKEINNQLINSLSRELNATHFLSVGSVSKFTSWYVFIAYDQPWRYESHFELEDVAHAYILSQSTMLSHGDSICSVIVKILLLLLLLFVTCWLYFIWVAL